MLRLRHSLLLLLLASCEPHAVIDLMPPDGGALGGHAGTGGDPGTGGIGGSLAGTGGTGGTAGDVGGGAGMDAGADSPEPEGPVLLHRYSFSQPGVSVIDNIGNAHGTLSGGATIAVTGGVVLDGVDDYVSLPPNMVSGLTNASFVIWATWNGDPETACWERFFDFGNSVLIEGSTDVREADRSFFMTPVACGGQGRTPALYLEFLASHAGMEFSGHQYLFLNAPSAPVPGEGHSYAGVVDEDALTMYFYIDGGLVAERDMYVTDTDIPFVLGDIVDSSNWLGRSQYTVDAYLSAELHEFRIYGTALSAEEVLGLHQLGPDQLPP